MHTVADVLSPGFGRSWHEAVAIVAEIASVVGSEAVPSAQDLLFDENGRLTLGFASESSEDPVPSLASLLSALLDGIDAPPQLRTLAADNIGPKPAHGSVQSFLAALAFFERPNRTKDLREVARRLGGNRETRAIDLQLEPQRPAEESSAAPTSVPEIDPELELRRLREKVSGGTPAAVEPNPELELQRLRGKVSGEGPDAQKRRAKRRRLTRRQKVLAAAAVLIVAFGALVATQWSRLTSVSAAAVGGGQERASKVVAGGLRRLGFTSEPATTPRVEAGRGAGARASAKKNLPTVNVDVEHAPRRGRDVNLPVRRASAKGHSTNGGDASTAGGGGGASAGGTLGSGRSSSTTAAPPNGNPFEFIASTLALERLRAAPVDAVPSGVSGASATPEQARSATVAEGPRVYTSANREVEPARLLRPQLPREPAPGDETGYFEILVDEQGTVEQVRLISPTRRYHDRMLVAAAKAWKFRPARLRGQSVKYELRIPIILKGLP